MRNFNKNTDLTTPEKYDIMMNFAKGISVEKTQELNQAYEMIKEARK